MSTYGAVHPTNLARQLIAPSTCRMPCSLLLRFNQKRGCSAGCIFTVWVLRAELDRRRVWEYRVIDYDGSTKGSRPVFHHPGGVDCCQLWHTGKSLVHSHVTMSGTATAWSFEVLQVELPPAKPSCRRPIRPAGTSSQGTLY